MLISAAQLPSSVMGPVTTLAGYFLFLMNFFAVIALIAVGGGIAYQYVKSRPMFGIEPGEMFFKVIGGLLVATAAADIAAVVVAG